MKILEKMLSPRTPLPGMGEPSSWEAEGARGTGGCVTASCFAPGTGVSKEASAGERLEEDLSKMQGDCSKITVGLNQPE